MIRRNSWALIFSIILPLMFLFGVSLLIAPTTRAAPNASIVVDTTIDDTDVNGNCTLREAVIAANTDTAVDNCTAGIGSDLIILPVGVYTLTIPGSGEDSSFTGDLDITASVIISGAGSSSTIIDGSDLDRIFHIDPTQSGGITVTIGNLTIRNGNSLQGGGIETQGILTLADTVIADNVAGDPFDGGEGGGIWNGGILTITRTTISENRIAVGGNAGGIYNENRLSIFDSLILNNMAYEGSGGGIHNDEGSMTISNTQISNNLAAGSGGIFSNSDFDVLIERSSITNNTGEQNTGGIHRQGQGTLSIVRSVVSENTSTFGAPGGIGNSILGGLIVLNSTIYGNYANGNCGGIDGGSFVLISNSSIISNTATNNGGGVCLSGGSMAFIPSVSNSTISGNSANNNGGGLEFGGFGPIHLNNVTIANNTADQDGDNNGSGGGISGPGIGSTITVQNTTLAGNQDLSTTEIYPDCLSDPAGIISNGYNLVGIVDGCNWPPSSGDQIGTIASPIDALLGLLNDNGGETVTHALLSGSPAIDAGNPSTPGSGGNSCAATDQRGISRPQGAICDIGAFELEAFRDLSISKSDSNDPIAAGSPLTYTLAITNVGTLTVTDIVITDTLPANVLFSLVIPGLPTCSKTGGEVICNYAGLVPSETLIVSIIVTPTTGVTITNTAVITSSMGDVNPGDNYAIETTQIALPLSSLALTGPSRGVIQNGLTFTATVNPISATLPISYVWQASGQAPVTHTSGLTDIVTYIWDMPGTQILTVTASNLLGTVTDTHVITITDIPISGLVVMNDSPTLLGIATTLSATISAGSNVSYTWDFGDDSFGIGAVVTHTYPLTGVFTTTVTANNSANLLTATTIVTITDPLEYIYLPLIVKGQSGSGISQASTATPAGVATMPFMVPSFALMLVSSAMGVTWLKRRRE